MEEFGILKALQRSSTRLRRSQFPPDDLLYLAEKHDRVADCFEPNGRLIGFASRTRSHFTRQDTQCHPMIVLLVSMFRRRSLDIAIRLASFAFDRHILLKQSRRCSEDGATEQPLVVCESV